MLKRLIFTVLLMTLPLTVLAQGQRVVPAANPTITKGPIVKAPPAIPMQEIIPLDIPLNQIPNYRQMMRDIVQTLSIYARTRDRRFVILVHDGFELFSRAGREFSLDQLKDPEGKDRYRRDPVGIANRPFTAAVDGVVVDGLNCGNPDIGKGTLQFLRREGITTYSIDHCADAAKAKDVVEKAIARNEIAHADTDKTGQLDTIPKERPAGENPANIYSPSAAKNMLAFLETGRYSDKSLWMMEMMRVNYDILIIDGFHNMLDPLTKQDVDALKFKRIGSKRLVFARMNLSMAEDHRYYWSPGWRVGNPGWIDGRDPDVPGGHFTAFWKQEWKQILGTYFAGLMDLGFDGIMLEGLDGYKYWEIRTPIE